MPQQPFTPIDTTHPLVSLASSGGTPAPDYEAMVQAEAKKVGLDPRFALGVLRAESNGDPLAHSPKGALGLMQLMPDTAAQYPAFNALHPDDNIRIGVRHLKKLMDKYPDPHTALAAYNAGEGAVQQYGGIPPFPETKDYIQRVYQRGGLAGAVRQLAADPTAAPATKGGFTPINTAALPSRPMPTPETDSLDEPPPREELTKATSIGPEHPAWHIPYVSDVIGDIHPMEWAHTIMAGVPSLAGQMLGASGGALLTPWAPWVGGIAGSAAGGAGGAGAGEASFQAFQRQAHALGWDPAPVPPPPQVLANIGEAAKEGALTGAVGEAVNPLFRGALNVATAPFRRALAAQPMGSEVADMFPVESTVVGQRGILNPRRYTKGKDIVEQQPTGSIAGINHSPMLNWLENQARAILPGRTSAIDEANALRQRELTDQLQGAVGGPIEKEQLGKTLQESYAAQREPAYTGLQKRYKSLSARHGDIPIAINDLEDAGDTILGDRPIGATEVREAGSSGGALAGQLGSLPTVQRAAQLKQALDEAGIQIAEGNQAARQIGFRSVADLDRWGAESPGQAQVIQEMRDKGLLPPKDVLAGVNALLDPNGRITIPFSQARFVRSRLLAAARRAGTEANDPVRGTAAYFAKTLQNSIKQGLPEDAFNEWDALNRDYGKFKLTYDNKRWRSAAPKYTREVALEPTKTVDKLLNLQSPGSVRIAKNAIDSNSFTAIQRFYHQQILKDAYNAESQTWSGRKILETINNLPKDTRDLLDSGTSGAPGNLTQLQKFATVLDHYQAKRSGIGTLAAGIGGSHVSRHALQTGYAMLGGALGSGAGVAGALHGGVAGSLEGIGASVAALLTPPFVGRMINSPTGIELLTRGLQDTYKPGALLKSRALAMLFQLHDQYQRDDAAAREAAAAGAGTAHATHAAPTP